MPGKGLIDAATPAPSLWALLTGLGGRRRLKLALTYTLALAENGLNVLYPYLTGIAIEALLAGARRHYGHRFASGACASRRHKPRSGAPSRWSRSCSHWPQARIARA